MSPGVLHPTNSCSGGCHVACQRTSSVGKECFASLQESSIPQFFPGTCVFHKDFHAASSCPVLDDPASPSIHASLLNLVEIIILYAKRTENALFLSKFQAQQSLILLVHNGMLNMSGASMGINTCSTRTLFQYFNILLVA